MILARDLCARISGAVEIILVFVVEVRARWPLFEFVRWTPEGRELIGFLSNLMVAVFQ